MTKSLHLKLTWPVKNLSMVCQKYKETFNPALWRLLLMCEISNSCFWVNLASPHNTSALSCGCFLSSTCSLFNMLITQLTSINVVFKKTNPKNREEARSVIYVTQMFQSFCSYEIIQKGCFPTNVVSYPSKLGLKA